MKKEIKKNSPEYSEEQVAATIGDIWFHNLTEKKRKQISKRDREPEKKKDKKAYEEERESSLRRNSMLAKLFKVAYRLDRGGFYDEAKAIDEVVQDLAQRVGLKMKPEDLVSIASFLDEQGDTELASQFDGMLETMAKTKERPAKE